MSDLIGRALGKYHIVARLGRGATGAVYKAHQPGLDRYVAINRPLDEDQLQTLEQDQISSAFGSLQYRHVEDRVDGGSDLASEIWRAFLLAMAFALIFEALLCLPDQRARSHDLRPDVPVTKIPTSMRSETVVS